MPDFAAMADAVVAKMREYVERAVAPLRAELEELKARPAPKDGRDGADGKPGESIKGDPGERGPEGPAGPQGPQGEPCPMEVVKALIEAQVMKSMAEIPRPRDGVDGKDGRDGFTPEDMELALEGRTITVKFTKGDTVVERKATIPAMLYRGVYKEGSEYEPGDTVTWGGSLWHCNKATTLKPETMESREHWTLAVKRGRDGKDGLRGEKGEMGPAGRPGLDGRRI